jgi:ABC-type transporter Mla subunit MlaD
VRAIRDTGRLGVDAGRVIEVNERAILANLSSLRPVLAQVGAASGQLVDALKIGFTIPFPAMTTTNAIRGDYANLFATLDLSTTSLAQMWLGGGAAFQSGDPVTSPLHEDRRPVGPRRAHAAPPPAHARHRRPGRNLRRAGSNDAVLSAPPDPGGLLMMLTPLIRRQLRVFVVLTIACVGLTTVVYARVPQQMGIGVYDVSADFRDASGLYPRAMVTYRGVKVGTVSALELDGDGARATLQLKSGTDIPADAVAELHSTSAIGEQYIDLVPGKATSYLEDGAVIPPAAHPRDAADQPGARQAQRPAQVGPDREDTRRARAARRGPRRLGRRPRRRHRQHERDRRRRPAPSSTRPPR